MAADASCSLTLEGFIPASEDRILVYCDTLSAPASNVAEIAETIDEISTSRVVGDDSSNVVEFTIPLVVLHTGQSVTLGEYLFRVLLYLLAFTGIGVPIFWCARIIGLLQSGIGLRGRINDN